MIFFTTHLAVLLSFTIDVIFICLIIFDSLVHHGILDTNFLLNVMFLSVNSYLLKYLFFNLLASIFLIGIGRFLKIKGLYLAYALAIFQIIISFISFAETLPLLIFVGTILFLLSYFVPYGNGAYFKIIEFGSFLQGTYPLSLKKITKKSFFEFILRVIIPIFPFIYSVQSIFPQIMTFTLIMTYIPLILLIYMNSQNKNKIHSNYKKIIFYTFIIFASIANQQTVSSNLLEIFIIIYTVFFTLDRVLTTFKDLKSEVENNNLLYILEKRCDDVDWLLENRCLNFSGGKVPTEKFLLKQIIIYFYLHDNVELLKLMSMYENNYDENLRFVFQLKYFVYFKVESQSKEDELGSKYKFLKNTFELEKGTLEYLPAHFAYGEILFSMKDNYHEIVKLFETNWFLLSNEHKYILYRSFLMVDKIKDAEAIKNEIIDFNAVDDSFNEN